MTEKRPSPLGSTAKTAHGCLAEDYAPWLSMVCQEWLAEREGKVLSTPGKIMRDVAESFVAAVRKGSSTYTTVRNGDRIPTLHPDLRIPVEIDERGSS